MSAWNRSGQPAVTVLEKPTLTKDKTSHRSRIYSSNWRSNILPQNEVKTSKDNVPSGFDQGQLPVITAPSLLMAENNGSDLYKIPRSIFRKGLIIRAPLHEAHFDQSSSQTTDIHKSTTDSAYGPIFTKIRKMIVVACHACHYVAIPLFTHNGVGLVNKHKKTEYISVQDHRYTGSFQPLSQHGKLKTEYLHPEVPILDIQTTAHFTYPLSRKYDLPVAVEGYLEDTDASLLASLLRNYLCEQLI